ncbi:MAG: hypothetical protein CM1200mP36_10890 [Gammaproteobacteria bacterium]|nr:MAG: hypothetical protein CM1200mP36_10890 [Gammaproteobacteria bacterium]
MKLTNKLSGRSEVVGLALGVLFCFSVGLKNHLRLLVMRPVNPILVVSIIGPCSLITMKRWKLCDYI